MQNKILNTITLSAGSVTVYENNGLKLHSYATGDALADVAYIVEGKDELIGIELPAFTASLEAWQEYIKTLGKPMHSIFICCHPAGADYIKGMQVYGTAGAKASISGGTAKAITDGLQQAFGDDFHGKDAAVITDVVSGKITLGGVQFELLDRGESYDLVIPAFNAIYTHMLGKTTHSILVSTDHIDAFASVLREYQSAGYELILTSHGGPEGQDAVEEKLRYLAETKKLAENCSNADDFKAAMQKAFPDYDGLNYLAMTAAALYK